METYGEVTRFLILLASLTISLGLCAQCLKMFRTKSAKDFTPLLVASLLFSELVWLNYGLVIQEWPIIASSGFNVIPVTLITIGYCLYRSDGTSCTTVEQSA
jgi:uncharacterized protein with PQ loop repeat